MDLQRLFSVLSGILLLTDQFKEAIEREMTMLSLPKNYMLLEAPRISDQAYFLQSGFAMSYSYDKGKKQVGKFWAQGRIVMSAKSLFEQVPARESIQLMLPSEVLFVSYEGVSRLFDSFSEANFICRVIMNQHLEYERQRIHDFQRLNSAELYDKLISEFPSIEQTVAQEHIASYLGIAPQSLSRIKRERDGS